MYLLALLIVIPLLEITVFIQVGRLIGAWPTVALVFLIAAVGMGLLRAQGLATLNRARASLERNEVPVREVFDGLCLVVGGVLLLLPGFVTDALAVLLFLPVVRNGLRAWALGYLRRRREMNVFVNGIAVDPEDAMRHPGGTGRPGTTTVTTTTIIDAEFHEIDTTATDDDAAGPVPPQDSRWGSSRSGHRR